MVCGVTHMDRQPDLGLGLRQRSSPKGRNAVGTTMFGIRDADVIEAVGGLLLDFALDYEMSHECLHGQIDESWINFRDWIKAEAADERVRDH